MEAVAEVGKLDTPAIVPCPSRGLEPTRRPQYIPKVDACDEFR